MAGNWSDMGTSATLGRLDGVPGFGVPSVVRPEVAFDSVYREVFPFVWRTARRLGVSDEGLDDVCQDVFVIVHRQLAEFAARSSLRTWVFGILHHVVQSHRRTLSRKSPMHRAGGSAVDPADMPDAAASWPDERLALAEAAQMARELLAQLDDDKRAVFVLADLEEMSAPEIAEALGLNLNTVYARLRAARAQFGRAVERRRSRDGWRTK